MELKSATLKILARPIEQDLGLVCNPDCTFYRNIHMLLSNGEDVNA